MSEQRSVAVIGCGIFGAMTALRLAEAGWRVTLMERHPTALQGSSFNNQNRLHLGFHYPRDDETARQCIRGFDRFKQEFPDCILDHFPNAYFIAHEGSQTTAPDYLAFCQRVGLRHDVIDLASFAPKVADVDLGVLCDEVVYDCSILRELVLERLESGGIEPRFSCDVTSIERQGERYALSAGPEPLGLYDAVVNCTYADVNRLTSQLGHGVPAYQYEYTMVPILEWDQPPVGITIMDGRFMTLLPFGKTGRFLMYHVSHTVVDTQVTELMPAEWRNPATVPSTRIDHQALFERMRDACAQFVPSVREARLTGFLEGPRVVLANRDKTDARPSIIRLHEPRFISVFTGKIDHCVWVADDVTQALNTALPA